MNKDFPDQPNEIEEGNIDPFTFMEDLEIEKVKI